MVDEVPVRMKAESVDDGERGAGAGLQGVDPGTQSGCGVRDRLEEKLNVLQEPLMDRFGIVGGRSRRERRRGSRAESETRLARKKGTEAAASGWKNRSGKALGEEG
ncbi:hypothetical protein EOD39_10430 [Acipenser ruthenus]|uniref:Uncharacterized protein n=1 Tax=Acipenser ruthenus TaxID=7906 RepID=A0A662YU56_ACIRT|nr:hypothetical protein EOD39_10430 [Acipenser ruthenus]